MSHYVSIKTKDEKYKLFKVPKEVQTYIKQLEHCIKYPEDSKLKELYKERLISQ